MIDEDIILNKKIHDKKNETSFKGYWSDIFFDENEIKKKIADQILSTEIFEFAKEYFGKLPMLRSICCYHTPGMKKIEATSSMNWHKDLHHKKLIKIMFFVSDVFKENGPTTVINKIDSKKIKYVNYPDYFSDEDLKNQNKEIKIDELTGEYIPVELGDSGIVVTNWQDEITRAAITNHYKFAINGGTDKHNYNASFSYQDREGIIKTTSLQRATRT